MFSAPQHLQISLQNREQEAGQSFHQATGSGQTLVTVFCVTVSMLMGSFCFPQVKLHFHLR